MMKYSAETTINLPRDRVIALFDDPENLPKWQDGLVSFEHLEGTAGQPGARSRLVYLMGKRRIEMIETVTERNLPATFSGTYEAKGVWNMVENHFDAAGPDKTHWRMDTEFRMSGLVMKAMAWIAPGMFRKQTAKMMADFKTFAEAAPRQ